MTDGQLQLLVLLLFPSLACLGERKSNPPPLLVIEQEVVGGMERRKRKQKENDRPRRVKPRIGLLFVP